MLITLRKVHSFTLHFSYSVYDAECFKLWLILGIKQSSFNYGKKRVNIPTQNQLFTRHKHESVRLSFRTT